MTSRALLLVTLLSFTAPAFAGFDEVVHAIETQSHVSHTRMPILGLARVAVWCIHPSGVRDFQLATFERQGSRVDGALIGSIMAGSMRDGFSPLVKARSSRRDEWTYIYARPAGQDAVELLVATRDETDTTVVRVVVDVATMRASMNEPRSLVRLARK